jgi:exopolysaccharide biosynthesis polyprenyl glycosylphosphotransferase
MSGLSVNGVRNEAAAVRAGRPPAGAPAWRSAMSGGRPAITAAASDPRDHRVCHAGIPRLRLSLPLSDRCLVLVALDLIALNLSLGAALAIRSAWGMPVRSALPPIVWFAALCALWLPVAAAFDVYDPRRITRPAEGSGAVKASLVVSVTYLMIPYVTPSLPGSRLALLVLPVITIVATSAVRGLAGRAMAQAALTRRTIIVGTGSAARMIVSAIDEVGGPAFHLLGLVSAGPEAEATRRVGGTGRRETHAPAVLGGWSELPDLVDRLRVQTLVLATADALDGGLLQTLTDCLERGVEIVAMPVLYEQLTGRVPVEYVGSNWHVAMPLDHPGTRGLFPALKRGMDVVLGAAGLLVLGALLPVVAAALYLDSPGPLFYAQRRTGRGGRVFTIYKLRSMVPDSEPDGAHWTEARDPRVTRVGRVLRRTHIDELPQCWNVLRGEMSAVGPRPERPEFVAMLSRQIPFYRVRHAIRPGMAGWGLVRQGYGASSEDALLKLQYDLYYIKHQSLWLDIVILLKTAMDALSCRGR